MRDSDSLEGCVKMKQVITYINGGLILDLEQRLTFLDTVNTESHQTILAIFQEYLYKKGCLPYINAKGFLERNNYELNEDGHTFINIGGFFSVYFTEHPDDGITAPYLVLNTHPDNEKTSSDLLKGLEYLINHETLSSLVELF